MKQVIVPEIDALTRGTYIDRPEGPVACGCGDDRECSHASSSQIKEDYGVNTKGAILRYFGGGLGAARIMLVTLAAQHGPEGLKPFAGRDIFEITADLNARAKEATGIVFALHSSTGNEYGDASLKMDSDKSVGCAYAGSLGTVSTGTYNPVILNASRAEGSSLFGPEVVDNYGRLAEANRLFVTTTLNGREDFSTVRGDFVRTKAPVMLLLHDHTNSSRTKSVTNFKPNKISNPDLAHGQGIPFYDNDVTQVAEAVIKSYPEYDFDPLTMLMAMDLDIRSTRGALVPSGNPLDLELQRYGNAQEALDYLSNL